MDVMPIGRMRSAGASFVLLMLFWVMLNGSLASDVLIVGAVASAAIALIYRDGLSIFTEARWTPAAIAATFGYIGYFLKELVKSNLHIAAVVLDPALPVHPGIVKVHTRLKSRMGRLLLANSITLTPGTLTVAIEDEWLYVHWVTMEAADQEEATRQIVAGFESYLEVMYG
ncbi:Na+/H+ antiporter subunit E [Pinisolibacter sp.]|uniref:Na+/H+ antiporter subunit E n=1 Tax=Pinisolibacter sp. TaxID=2172024 RepID=UPI002FDD9457